MMGTKFWFGGNTKRKKELSI